MYLKLKIPEPVDVVSSLKWHPHAGVLAYTTWGTNGALVDVNDAENPQVLLNLQNGKASMECEWSPSGALLAIAGDEIEIVNPYAQTSHILGAHSKTAPVFACRFLQDDLVISGAWDPVIKIWDLRTQEVNQEIRCQDTILAFDNHGYTLLVTGKNGFQSWYDIRRDNLPFTTQVPFMHSVNCMAVSGNLAIIGSLDGRVSFWYDLPRKWGKDHFFTVSKTLGVSCVAINPVHGKYFVTGCGSELKLWNARNGTTAQQMCQYVKDANPLNAVTFSPDGAAMAYATGRDLTTVTKSKSKAAPLPNAIYLSPV